MTYKSSRLNIWPTSQKAIAVLLTKTKIYEIFVKSDDPMAKVLVLHNWALSFQKWFHFVKIRMMQNFSY